jgi:glutamine amidotransferase
MITIVDSGGANISSILFALERLGVEAVLTADIDKIAKAERVILPGVGAAKDAMDGLRQKGLEACITSLTCPVLGICLGMQMLFTSSEEGNAHLLNLIPGPVRRFQEEEGKTIPHMGWDTVVLTLKDHPLVKGVEDGAFFYFVHSYFAPVGAWSAGTCTYFSDTFSAIVAHDNFMGCQFHPERSGSAGSKILENFARL